MRVAELHLAQPRIRRRAWLVAKNAINSLLVPLLNPIVALLVIQLASAAVWGEFVQVMLIVQLAAHVAGWGNKEYLLRQFSFNPAAIARQWQSSLVTRLLLLAPFAVLALAAAPRASLAAWIVAWSVALVVDQSYDVLIVYRKDFAFSTVVELGGLAVQIGLLLTWAVRINLDSLLVVFTVSTAAKTMAYLIRFRRHTLAGPGGGWAWRSRIDPGYFRHALSFFLLGLTGLLGSRIDLYAVALFLPRQQIAQYQVYTTFILYLQSASNFILAPFVKGLYRMPSHVLLGLSARLTLIGVALIAPGMVAVYAMLTLRYGFDLGPALLLVGGLLALPAFFYLPIVYALFKAGAQATVVKLNLLGIAVSGIASVCLLPLFGMLGAAMAGALAQWVILAGYVAQARSIRETHVAAVPRLS